jgi:hypothetical protein
VQSTEPTAEDLYPKEVLMPMSSFLFGSHILRSV